MVPGLWWNTLWIAGMRLGTACEIREGQRSTPSRMPLLPLPGNLSGPRELDGFGDIRGSVSLAELHEDFDFAGLAVCHVDSKLDAAGIARARVEAVTPLEPGFALGARGARVAAHRIGFKHGPRGLGGFDTDAPSETVGLLVSHKSVVAVEHCVIGVDVGEVLVLSATRNVCRSFDQLSGS